MTDIKSETITGGRPGSGAHRVVALCGPYLSGKTSLLESILYATGAIGRRGSTRAGTSIGDGAAEARKRGMGTEINVASVDYLGDQWTFLDVPGSIEFQHDAFAALAVCDAAVLVCEPSPERVVALTPLLKYIEDHHIPHIIFVNKIDSAEVRVRDMLSALQGVSSRKLVLRQVPIRRPTNDGGEETVGYVDLVSERAYRYKCERRVRPDRDAGRDPAARGRGAARDARDAVGVRRHAARAADRGHRAGEIADLPRPARRVRRRPDRRPCCSAPATARTACAGC